MDKTGRTLTALFGIAVFTTVLGASLTGCSPLDESQKFNPSDTASASSSVTGPTSL